MCRAYSGIDSGIVHQNAGIVRRDLRWLWSRGVEFSVMAIDGMCRFFPTPTDRLQIC